MTKRQKLSITVGISTAFISTFAGSALTIAIPSMGSYFNMGTYSVGWMITLYMLAVAAFSTPLGNLADDTGRRRILMIGVVSFGVTSVFSVFAWNALVMLLLRLLQGISAAMIFATNMPIAISAFSEKERGKAIGLVTAGTYTGLALGPVLGGILNECLGWKSIFIFSALTSLVSFVCIIKGVNRDEVKRIEGKQNISGNVIYAFMIATFIYGLTSFNSISFGWVFILIGILLGFVFVKNELRAENPIIDVRIFAGNMTYTLSNLTALLNFCATFAIGYLLSIYLQVVLGYSSRAAGLILITQPIFMAALSPIMGKLSDKLSAYKMATVGMALCTVSLLFFAFLNKETSTIMVILALAVIGIGVAFFSSPNTNMIMGCVPTSKFAVANSILATMRTTGQSCAMAIITIVVSGTIGDVDLYELSSGQLINTIHVSFIVFTVLCAIGIAMSMQRKHT